MEAIATNEPRCEGCSCRNYGEGLYCWLHSKAPKELPCKHHDKFIRERRN